MIGDGMRLHHVGYVVREIELYAQGFPGLRLEREVEDPLQHARLALFDAGGTFIEMIRPHSPEAFTWNHLERTGEGMHHVCYDTQGGVDVDELLSSHRMLKIRGPMHAPLFDRPVLFAMTRKKAIVEFIL